ncbi:MAG: methyltransferase domain-containing protein, partial [Candidatus Spechtbacterales bacterium]|nr:methyltransferase domain-containing protein [Candidatus Spechtbacterales bacterium]
MTKLQRITDELLAEKGIDTDADRGKKQTALDEITPEVMEQLTPEDITEHTSSFYNENVDYYIKKSHSQGIIDELVNFMNSLSDGARVLDVGCGPGRDTLFMSIPDKEYRKTQMTREKNGKSMLERGIEVPSNSFRVVGIDRSLEMIEAATFAKIRAAKEGFLEDMSKARFVLADMHTIRPWDGEFDAVWSCTALFTHTPRSLSEQSLQNVS